MNYKNLVLDSLINDDECFTEIFLYFMFVKVRISVKELQKLLDEMVKDGYIRVLREWQNEYYEYPYSLTEKGRAVLEKLDF